MKIEELKEQCNLIALQKTHDIFVTYLDGNIPVAFIFDTDLPLVTTLVGGVTMAEDQAVENQRSQLGCISCRLFGSCKPEATYISNITATSAEYYAAQKSKLSITT